MEYESGMEIVLAHFDGHAFNALSMKKQIDRQRILLLSRSQVIECITQPIKQGTVRVLEAHLLLGLSSIKFNRAQFGAIILQFKGGKILEFKVKNAGQFADLIKSNMMANGVTGKIKKSKSLMDCIGSAEELMKRAQDLEEEFSTNPSFELVQEFVDGLKEVVEKFDAANDERYSMAIKTMQKFLTRDDVLAVLDRKLESRQGKSNAIPAPKVVEHVQQTIDDNPSKSADSPVKPDNGYLKELPPELRITPRKNIVNSEEDNAEVEELSAMLGDITQEFNDLISSFGENPADISWNGEDIETDNFDEILSSSFLSEK